VHCWSLLFLKRPVVDVSKIFRLAATHRNRSLARLLQLTLIADEQLRLTDDVDEQHMADLDFYI